MKKLGSTIRHKPSPCLACGKLLDASNAVGDDEPPEPGSITICMCGHIMAYGDDLAMRALTDAEMHAVAGDPDILQAQEAIGRTRQELAERDRIRRWLAVAEKMRTAPVAFATLVKDFEPLLSVLDDADGQTFRAMPAVVQVALGFAKVDQMIEDDPDVKAVLPKSLLDLIESAVNDR